MPTVYLALGANIPGPAGPPEATLAAAAERLAALGRIAACSSLYSTAPVGLADQPRFLNAVLGLETNLPPRELLDQLLRIEREFGRDRSASVPNGPRTLDLDILLYGSEIIHEPGLEIPHPRLAERAFVLVPLAEIASNLVVPGTAKTVQQLLQGLRAGLPSENDAVFSIQSSIWRSGSRVDRGRSGGASA
ncbi:MAG: 2-amino-4-hydroxy-6-hydroxymethyldihydropteridine diphosphokinase [Terracidiphilus sp.]